MSELRQHPAATAAPARDTTLLAYRIVAMIVGVGLVVLVLIGVPLKYAAGQPIVVKVVGPLHGFLYVVYLLLTLQLWLREKWNPVFAVLVAAAGTVPFLSFVAERKVTPKVRARR
ncbi:MAG TPA: DUF3817 domain-containing protein [Mycobacteriales bacterium]|nr:DUF3817 domain-containing protein [Mycobacteriales bacterium]